MSSHDQEDDTISLLLVQRLKMEWKLAKANNADKDRLFTLMFDPDNKLYWYALIRGISDDYESGQYLISIKLSTGYPAKSPVVRWLTPQGRFEVDTPICLNITSYHSDTNNVAWRLISIVQALISMLFEYQPGIGAINPEDSRASSEAKRKFALESADYNLKHNSEIVDRCNLALQ